jgi:hypothetical protein
MIDPESSLATKPSVIAQGTGPTAPEYSWYPYPGFIEPALATSIAGWRFEVPAAAPTHPTAATGRGLSRPESC